MLVVSRRSHESIVIGGSGGLDRQIRVTVIDVRDGVVKLGIEADADIPVHRAEAREQESPIDQSPATGAINHSYLSGVLALCEVHSLPRA